MTPRQEQLDDMQRQCLQADVPMRSLYMMGKALDQQKPSMSESQLRVQRMIEGAFHQKAMRVMGYQYRRQ